MKHERVARLLVGVGVLLLLAVVPDAYWLNGPKWPGASIVMHLQLGSSGALIDGCASWGCSAESALSSWNRYLNTTQFTVVRDSTAPISSGNRVNNVFFEDDVFGRPFGEGTVAVTSYSFIGVTMVEGDVVFNRKLSWNSYRGPLRNSSTGGRLYDFRRVATHEFGHVLGLGHPDEHAQVVVAIMNSRISDLDDLANDDIQGAFALHGGGAGGGTQVNFPPRDQTRAFRDDLEPVYRNNLGRGQISTFVDVEGSVVWIQEYVRYRLNACNHDQASARTLTQLLGGGVQPVCGPAPPGPMAFPPRDQTRAFRDGLEPVYRDTLRRGAILTYVDIEGDVVWIQEYVRYRLLGCGHAQGENKVILQITGEGVQPPCNQPPVVNSLTVAPGANGVDQLTVFAFSASASDPDGDPITYQWNLGDGTSATGPSVTKVYRGGGDLVVVLTVSDNKGGTTTASRTITVASMGGSWRGSQATLGQFTMTLTQTGSVVTGTYFDSSFGPGQIDPSQPGRIDLNRNVEMRVKQALFTDFTFRGTIDSSGRRVTGGIFGSGFTGQPFTMDKQ